MKYGDTRYQVSFPSGDLYKDRDGKTEFRHSIALLIAGCIGGTVHRAGDARSEDASAEQR